MIDLTDVAWKRAGSPLARFNCSGPRALLVGEANPYFHLHEDPTYALYPLPENASGGRLQRLVLGMTRADYTKCFDRVNLCESRWSVVTARATAQLIWAAAFQGRWDAVVICGTKCGMAIGQGVGGATPGPFGHARVFREHGQAPFAVAEIPHPSGLCRAWNQPGAFERARAAIRAAAPWLPIREVLP